MKPSLTLFGFYITALTAACAMAAPSNAVTISNLAGSVQANRPFTISRVFAKGEIANYPQPSIGGTPLSAWQADVKNRWPDGSVRHALISFVTTLTASGTATISFVNSASSSSSGSALTQAQMLNFDAGEGAGLWSADIEATNGTTQTANLRTMLSSGYWTYWQQGPVVTSVIIEGGRAQSVLNELDPAHAYDFDLGWDTYKPLHPIFVVTFYQSYAGIQIQAIVENAWSLKGEDVSYSLAVKYSASSTTPSNTFYSRSIFDHYARARWRKVFWIGSQPGAVKTDLNLPYLSYSKALATYDLTRVVGSDSQNYTISDYTSTNCADGVDFGETCDHAASQHTTGGRPELGPYDGWTIKYLYTFNPSIYTAVIGNAEAIASFPNHFKESYLTGGSSLGYCASSGTGTCSTAKAFGRPVSIDAHPSMWLSNPTYSDLPAADQVANVGTVTLGGLDPHPSHEPDPGYLAYLITGDWYFYGELSYRAHWDLAMANYYIFGYSRHMQWGIFSFNDVEYRGHVWAMRSMGLLEFITPDPAEQLYILNKLNNNVAAYEGVMNITNGTYTPTDTTCGGSSYDPTNTNPWCFGRVTIANKASNPLHFPAFNAGTVPSNYAYINAAAVLDVDANWQDNYGRVVYGIIQEQGDVMGITPMQTAGALNLANQISNSSVNPYVVNTYQSPMLMSDGNWAATWASYANGFTSGANTWTAWQASSVSGDDVQFVGHSYVHIARAASSFGASYTDSGTGVTGQSAYVWLTANTPDQFRYGSNMTCAGLNEGYCDDPHWAIIARALAPTGSACDLNADGIVDMRDVQLSISQALGTSPCVATLGTGTCNVIVVERVVVALLGGTCQVGP